jgi:hypothetical protein
MVNDKVPMQIAKDQIRIGERLIVFLTGILLIGFVAKGILKHNFYFTNLFL